MRRPNFSAGRPGAVRSKRAQPSDLTPVLLPSSTSRTGKERGPPRTRRLHRLASSSSLTAGRRPRRRSPPSPVSPRAFLTSVDAAACAHGCRLAAPVAPLATPVHDGHAPVATVRRTQRPDGELTKRCISPRVAGSSKNVHRS